MQQPTSFYKTQLDTFKQHVSRLNKQLIGLSSIRLVVFVLTVVGVYFTYNNWQVAAGISVFGIVAFLITLSKYTDTKWERDLNKALVTINEEELTIASGQFQHRDSGTEFQEPKHFYSLDIDLFGNGSFFQFINRTSITEGKTTLANLLKANNISNIKLRQEVVKELSSKPEWRQLYSATASLIHVEVSARYIIQWLTQHKQFLPKIMRWLPMMFSGITVLFFVLFLFKILDVSILGYWLLLGLFITGVYVKKINILSQQTDKAKDTFKQYSQLLKQIENTSFSSELLQEKQQKIQNNHKKASVIFKQFSKYLDALDNRNNLIGAIFGNGLFLTDLKNSYKIEQWIATYNKTVADWFEVVTFFDAYNSLGNYAFNHPEFVYPKLVNKGICIKAEQLGHPLLQADKRVDSDLNIDNEQFFIVTGANMAGKSTFLRTVSLHIVMANVGLPVCAHKSEYSPIKLITSMRTSDSLTDDSSYFFSELTRLKFIVDAIKTESYFIILDEILKGTNSTDKAIGSQKFVEKLVSSHATGIIATHDLSLTKIETNLDQVKNYFFDAEIKNEELYFDYKLKKGVCQNMNASFLLKKMEIV
ncbi:MutS-related protein [Mangrovimonas cancribranchiae]|uniref:DNA mismatch repair protein MutS n=1 Tax=Mangrovimonas cancribranchiae TaxID=3080055 RepID=A0AAU6P7A4_9FLAO